MDILVTGFEPFGGETVNPSWEAAARLPEWIGGHHVHRLKLPVVFGACGEILQRAVEEIHPQVVVMCGVAGGRTEVTPELLAVNWRMGSIPDNSGAHYTGEKIAPNAPDAIMTALPVTDMVEQMKAASIPARLSLSAGAYVCNDLYFSAMRLQEQAGFRGVFIHVPPFTALPLETDVQALGCCIRAILRSME